MNELNKYSNFKMVNNQAKRLYGEETIRFNFLFCSPFALKKDYETLWHIYAAFYTCRSGLIKFLF